MSKELGIGVAGKESSRQGVGFAVGRKRAGGNGTNRLATEKVAYDSAMGKNLIGHSDHSRPLVDCLRNHSTKRCFLATYNLSIPYHSTSMAVNKKKKRTSRRLPEAPVETRTSEAITVGWTVTLTTLLLCNLVAIGAHYYAVAHPEAQRMALLREMLLFAGAVVGSISLVLLPLMHRVRQTPPPRGLVAFGICIAIGPILVVALRALR